MINKSNKPKSSHINTFPRLLSVMIIFLIMLSFSFKTYAQYCNNPTDVVFSRSGSTGTMTWTANGSARYWWIILQDEPTWSQNWFENKSDPKVITWGEETGTGTITATASGLPTSGTLYVYVVGVSSSWEWCEPSPGEAGAPAPPPSSTPPAVSTTSAYNISAYAANSGGNVTSDGGASVSERGVVWNTSGSPTTSSSKATSGTGTGSYTVSMTSLSVNQTYYYRAYAINSEGTSYGSQYSFTTVDNEPPTVYTKNITVYLNSSGLVSIADNAVDNGSTDNCGIASYSTSKTSFTCSDVGNNTVTLTVTDVNGNSASNTATVTVVDNIAPDVYTKNITVQLNEQGLATITEDAVNNNSADACGILSYETNINDFSCDDYGENTVTLTVTDIHGNSANKTAVVTIEDNVPPVVRTKDIVIQLNSDGVVSIAEAAVNNNSTDACGILTYETDTTSFDCSDVGENTVTLTVTDIHGNSEENTAVVTVEDNIPPVVITKNIVIQLDSLGMASITEDQVDNNSTDACGIASYETDTTSFDCSDVGNNTVTLTLTDVNGNSAHETAIVTVEDNFTPTVITKNITIQLDESGQASIEDDSVDNNSWDACGIASYSTDIKNFDCSDVGGNTVTLTVTDIHGNSNQETAVVTVEDNVAPVVTTKDITIGLDHEGRASIEEDEVNDVSTDACGIASYDTDINEFSCSDVGGNTVELTVTDVNGNFTKETAVVTVEDNIAPDVYTKDIVVQLNIEGKATIVEDSVNNNSWDACGIAGYDTDITSFDCSDVGDNTVTLTVTDVNGNSAQNTANVKIEDNVNPTVFTKMVFVYLNKNGEGSIDEDEVDDGSWDACGIAGYDTDKTEFDCSDVGRNIVRLTVTDVNGNSTTEDAIVYVKDNIRATIEVKDIIVELDGNGHAEIAEDAVDNGSWDACGIVSFDTDITVFDCSNVGANEVYLTIADVNGNRSGKHANVTVVDNTPPVIHTQNIIVELDENGEAEISENELNNSSWDACGIESFLVSKTSFNSSDIGDNTVKLTVTDVNGNSTSTETIVTVTDNTIPSAVCKDITIYLDVNGLAIISGENIDNGSSDNCGIASMIATPSEFSCSDIGQNMVTLEVTDGSGNTSRCTSVLTVLDTLAPVVVCQDFDLYLDANGEASVDVSDINNGIWDASGIAELRVDKTKFSCSDSGRNNVTLSTVDENGNESTCTATVNVNDTIAPDAMCRNITVYLDSLGHASVLANDVDNNSSDNCGISGFAVSKTEFSCEDVGENEVIFSVTDNYGNVSTCMPIITVLDTIPPAAMCKNTSVYLNEYGTAMLTSDDINNGSWDACGITSIELNINQFDCTDIGDRLVLMSVSDNNGNVSKCNSIVTVMDRVEPKVVCKDTTLYLDANGMTASLQPIDLEENSFDNCEIVFRELSQQVFDCSNLAENVVTLTINDSHGNYASCSSVVTVIDTVPPVAICKDVTLYLSPEGNAEITSEELNNGSYDNCSVAQVSISKNEFDCSSIGENNVELTVADNSGNTAVCEATVTVLDTIPPTVVCKDITVYLNDNGIASVSSGDLDGGSEDNCGISGIEIDKTVFSCNESGVNNVILTVSDNSGNTASCTSSVTVVDTIAPVAICKDLTIYLDENGQATILAEDIENGSSDNCGISFIEIDKTLFGCEDTGSNIVTLSVNDSYGNVSTCESVITVLDTINPVIQPINDIVIHVEPAVETTTIDYPEVIASDNCSASLELASGLGAEGLFPVGVTTENWIATDASGNQSEISFKVTVVQTLNPSIGNIADIVAEEDTPTIDVMLTGISTNPGNEISVIEAIYTNNNGATLIKSAKVEYTAGESEGTLVLEITPDMSGSEEVTVTVSDDAGRKMSQSFTVTIMPVNDAPYLVMPIEDMEIQLPHSFAIPISLFKDSIFADIDDKLLELGITEVGSTSLPVWVSWDSDSVYADPTDANTGCASLVVTATDAGGLSVTDTFSICVYSAQVLGVNDFKLVDIKVNLYPNPTKGFVKIELSKSFYNELGLSVFDNSGQIVLKKTFARDEDISFDLSGMVSGLYYVRLESEGNFIIKKLMVDKN